MADDITEASVDTGVTPSVELDLSRRENERLRADFEHAARFGRRVVEELTNRRQEDLSLFTFDGLKRRMGLHPETLSRILNRLEAEGIVKKSSEGYTVTKEIAKQKNISFHTVMTHRKNIFRKLGINNVSELLMVAMKTGLIDTIEYYI